jgi:hypothetical protein
MLTDQQIEWKQQARKVAMPERENQSIIHEGIHTEQTASQGGAQSCERRIFPQWLIRNRGNYPQNFQSIQMAKAGSFVKSTERQTVCLWNESCGVQFRQQ